MTIEAALTQIEVWRKAGLHVPISVNIGARHLLQPDFIMHLRGMLSRHPGAQPQDLELEILETSAVEDFVQVSQLMALCERMGLRFALDDFGSGYSSLTYLKRLPAHLLKIDQGFIRDMLEDRTISPSWMRYWHWQGRLAGTASRRSRIHSAW